MQIEQKQPRCRLELEARLLAGQDDEIIAQPMALAPDLVALYARLFYDVRDHLTHRDYILTRILGATLAQGPLSREQVVRLFAHVRGPAVVDGALQVYDTPEISALFATDVRSRLAMDPLRLAFEVKLLGGYRQLPVPVQRLLGMTLQRLGSRPSLAQTSRVLGDLDLDHLLRDSLQAGTCGVPVQPDTLHELAETREIPLRPRLRYAT